METLVREGPWYRMAFPHSGSVSLLDTLLVDVWWSLQLPSPLCPVSCRCGVINFETDPENTPCLAVLSYMIRVLFVLR